jgi:DNA-binding LacI/PurR family transcriptional regulator
VSKSRPPSLPIRSTAEFARYVGLSRSAISRVLNGRPGLRGDTIERVQQAIAETGFVPNAHARHLRGAPSALVGVCMENFLTPTAVAKLSALQRLLAAAGYSAVVEMSRPGAYDKVVRHFLSLRVEAVVFIGHFEPAELAQRVADLKRHRTTHLVVDNSGLPAVNTVTLDRAAAMRAVVEHLLALRHRRFGLLGLSGDFQTVTDRLEGLQAALRARGLDPARCLVSHDERFARTEHFDYGRTLAASFAAERERPGAFIAVNDDTAIGALLEFQARGLRVPEDVSIVGFNNQAICLMTRPRLTSVDQRIEETASAAAEVLLAAIRGQRGPKASVRHIAAQLVVRESTGPAR